MTATDAPTTPATAAHLTGVNVRIGATAILTDIDLDVAEGHIVAIVGGNGAGKTTLLDALAGEVPTTGRIELAGTGRIARVLQASPLPDTLTVAEVLELATDHHHAARELAERFGLTASLDRRVLELSTGMRRILDLAVATVDHHDLLLLDEPASGLAAAEVDHLADLLLAHRDRTGVAIVVVEHHLDLVDAIADRVVTLDHGRIIDPATTDEPAREGLPPLVVGDPDTTASALTAIATAGVPAPQPARHELSTWTKLRLGLREFAAGMASVLILGVLNRVMKVELGISLAVVAVVLASYNLAAPAALAIGHRSDQQPLRGHHRTPYILGGATLTALTLAAAPHVADRLAAGVTIGSVALALLLFTIMGVGMYGAGTVYFALLADLTPRHERAHAASVVYLMLMGGIITGAALAAALLDDAGNGRHALFAIAGIVVIALNVAAVWGLDPRQVDDAELPEPTGAWQAVREITAIRGARRFFAFTLLATLFLFLQQAVLEPFGGDVLGLSVRATTGFNAVQTLGVIVGMLVTGRGIADRHGHKRTALVGLVGSSVAFAGLAMAALVGSAPASWFAILGIGLTTGLFNVAVLALMMAMSVPERVALFMGAWTVSHALADGLATAGGGIIQQLALTVATTDAGAYATVFAIESVGLALCIPLLRSIDVTTFAREVAEETARRSALAMGWIASREPR